MQKVIGISGFAKSGKSTLAKLLVEKHGAKEIIFADHLKNVCAEVFDIPRNHFDDQSLKEVKFAQPYVLSDMQISLIIEKFGITDWNFDEVYAKHEYQKLTSPRHIAQYVGTDILRDIDSDIHVKTAMRKIEGQTGVFVVSDMRFQNEFDAVITQGVTVGIVRDAVRPDLSNVHESERHIDSLVKQCTHVIENNSTMEEFQAQVENLVKSII